MSGSTRNISSKTTVYIIAIVFSAAAFILLESWPGARALMQQLDKSLGITNLNWALPLFTLLIGFLLGVGISKRK